MNSTILSAMVEAPGWLLGTENEAKGFVRLKVKEADNVFSGTNINPDKQSRKKIRILHREITTFPGRSRKDRKDRKDYPDLVG